MFRKIANSMLTFLFALALMAGSIVPVTAGKDVHPRFQWGKPGPSSSVVHPGSIRGAGMLKGPLQEIDPVIERHIEQGTMPGAVTLVARKGHIVQHEAYGHAYLYEDDQGNQTDDPLPMKKDSIFDLASISKIFTSTAAMILYEQGAFELDDPVAEHLPEFAANGKEDVTIRQLMTHTSGFTPWIPLYTIGDSREDRIQHVLHYPLENAPGTTYTYSDLNMITLGVLVEELSNQRLDQFVRERITSPLGMTDTMYNPPAELHDRIAATEYQPGIGRGLVHGEVHDESAWSLDGVAGHAGVFSTATDLAKFAHMFLQDGSYGGKQILQPETVELLTENQIPEFPGNEHGLGWELMQGWYMDGLSDSQTIGHTGYTGTSLVISQQNDTIAILLTNRVHPSRNTVSTNPARQDFAGLVADSIPVDIPKGTDSWFSGYGDDLSRTLTAEMDVQGDATLTFNTWYNIENHYDYGKVEFSKDGVNWEELDGPYTGASDHWLHKEFHLPHDTNHIRFTYQTDGGANGRGWYLNNLQITDVSGNPIPYNINTNEWTQRDY
ncbi:serine hydrolase [Virgibacillus xinjiangensis]|uniref:Serine hydrolase n=1 Tax=Virgibacillus xinjiangensis TaxID=393090 RepID=A0ABV7CZ01_9BACI